MKRIGILTAGGDTPALNAALAGAVVRAHLTQPCHSIHTDVNQRIRSFTGPATAA